MKKIKDFIQKCRLNSKIKEQERLLELINCYIVEFSPIPIYGKKLILPYFDEETINTVANKLNYNFIAYPDKDKDLVVIVFSKRETKQ